MKLAISFILLSLVSCAAIKTNDYCEAHWQERYKSWQDCYDSQRDKQSGKDTGSAIIILKSVDDKKVSDCTSTPTREGTTKIECPGN